MTQARPTLVIGTKSWSSWSLRPWLLMKQKGLSFDEIVVRLRSPSTAADIALHSPSGKVPVLIDGGEVVWDSLAIAEYLAEQHPTLGIWPEDRQARAMARSVSAEMHSGFQALRQNCPMDINAQHLAPADPVAISGDVARIVAIWRDCRARFGAGGPYLFGGFSAADAMYAPVASRFVSYDIDLAAAGDGDGAARRYVDAIWALPALAEWRAAAAREPEANPTPAPA